MIAIDMPKILAVSALLLILRTPNRNFKSQKKLLRNDINNDTRDF